MSLKILQYPKTRLITVDELKEHLRIDGTNEDALLESLLDTAVEWAEQYEQTAYLMRRVQYGRKYWSKRLFLPLEPVQKIDSVSYLNQDGEWTEVSSDHYVLETTDSGRACLTFDYLTFPFPALHVEREERIRINYIAGYECQFEPVYETTAIVPEYDILEAGDTIQVYAVDGILPAPLEKDAVYTIDNVDENPILDIGNELEEPETEGIYRLYKPKIGRIASRVKSAVKLLAAYLYENREEAMESRLELIPFGVKNLLYERKWNLES